ncbi:MAG: sugar transferase [Porticoccaceae bacterium]|nr:sugar transferase [Pseudomonadales bacterium]
MSRSFEIVITILLLILLAPIFLIVYLVLLLNLGSPVIFRQTRLGLHNESFVIYKYRTMKNLVDEDGLPLPDFERLGLVGSIVRSASLDELPGLWNVLKGEMSLVGPRPLLPEYLLLYDDEQRRRHEVKPGITGWAQVNGRNAISWEQKFKLDVWYVDNRSFWLDVKILFLTIKKVVTRDGISSSSEVTMEKFTGNE